jgi:hypothetical protein
MIRSAIRDKMQKKLGVRELTPGLEIMRDRLGYAWAREEHYEGWIYLGWVSAKAWARFTRLVYPSGRQVPDVPHL